MYKDLLEKGDIWSL